MPSEADVSSLHNTTHTTRRTQFDNCSNVQTKKRREKKKNEKKKFAQKKSANSCGVRRQTFILYSARSCECARPTHEPERTDDRTEAHAGSA